MNDLLKSACQGALAGFGATGPMTMFMEAAHLALPGHERDPLPPRAMTENALSPLGSDSGVSEAGWQQLSVLNHYGIGTGLGALYGPLAGRVPLPPVVAGIGFGLGVWAASCLGVLPAAGLYRPPRAESVPRHGLMIAAHCVWGAAVGLALDALNHPRCERDQAASRRLPLPSAEACPASPLLTAIR